MHPFRIVEENLRSSMACYARVSDTGASQDYDRVVATSCGQNIAVFNSALLRAQSSESELMEAVSVADSHFRERSLGWSFWLCDDLIPIETRRTSRNLFFDRGMGLVAQPPGMYAEKISPPARDSAGMTFRRIEDDRTRLEFAHISSVVFALPFDSAHRVYCRPALWQPPMRGWIGYVNNKAVSVMTVVLAADAAGIYSLGTLPQHQGCGYGEALLRFGLDEIRKETGITRSVLQSTEEGYNLYLRMGYRVVTSFSVYTKETCG